MKVCVQYFLREDSGNALPVDDSLRGEWYHVFFKLPQLAVWCEGGPYTISATDAIVVTEAPLEEGFLTSASTLLGPIGVVHQIIIASLLLR